MGPRYVGSNKPSPSVSIPWFELLKNPSLLIPGEGVEVYEQSRSPQSRQHDLGVTLG
jgi:hypothetical protein